MTQVLMPRLSDTMTEGVVTQWLKHEGETVQRGDVLAEIETDKATMELEAFESGVLRRILVEPGDTVAIGTPIAVIGDDTPSADSTPDTAGPTAREPTPGNPPPPTAAATKPATPPSPSPRPLMSPLARSLAARHGLDLAEVTGSGPGGRIVRADIEAAIAAQTAVGRPLPARGQATLASPPLPGRAAGDEAVPLSSIRRITARRLSQSAAVPHFALTATVDAGAVLALRSELNDDPDRSGPKVTVTDLLALACAKTLPSHPQMNSSWAEDHLLRHGHINIGWAVALDDGLIVPVVKDADRKSLTEIAVEIHGLTESARAGTLTPDEFTGGTFTISNLGMYGVDHFTAVINPPEAGILAVGAATEEAVVRGGQVTAATTIKLTLSVDHRVVDGATAAMFLRDLVSALEHPLRILI